MGFRAEVSEALCFLPFSFYYSWADGFSDFLVSSTRGRHTENAEFTENTQSALSDGT
jgi:hypothetical protein